MQGLAHSLSCQKLDTNPEALQVLDRSELPDKDFSFAIGLAVVRNAKVEATFQNSPTENVSASGGVFVLVFPTQRELKSIRLLSGTSLVEQCSVTGNSGQPC